MRMNRYSGLMAAGIAVLSLTANAQSLLQNGGFENVSGGAPKKWIVQDWKASDRKGSVKAVSESEGAREGDKFVRIVSDAVSGNLVMMQDITKLTAGHYRLSLQCRPDAGCVAYASVVGLAKDKKKLLRKETGKVSRADEWTEQTLDFTLPEGTAILRLLLRSDCGASFDAVSLTPIDPNAPAANEPSTADAVSKKEADLEYSMDFDRDRKAKMTPAERAWEQTLEENLGAHYLPRYKRAKQRGVETAWDYVQDDPALPRVLLIGDSISRGYTLPVRHILAGKANVHRAPANCSSTERGLEKLDGWLGEGGWDLIHFNFGIHDRESAPADYARRLERIVRTLQATEATVVFATSTPMPENSGKYPAGICARLNAEALQVMTRRQIPVNDLYGRMIPRQVELQFPADCHFTEEGYRFLGEQTADVILKQLSKTEPGFRG